jgi:hypothetical protein
MPDTVNGQVVAALTQWQGMAFMAAGLLLAYSIRRVRAYSSRRAVIGSIRAARRAGR